jgi:hypothetical protein
MNQDGGTVNRSIDHDRAYEILEPLSSDRDN